ncbi:MAG: zinc ribbon domain-containing protein [Candidatus Binataceae bacterium]|jgi:putative FmdB family regulatory protein
MPIYEYRCDDCGSFFEALVSASRPEAECPSCHGANLSRELSVFAAARGSGDSPCPPMMARGGGGGGCCAGGCGCGRR